MGYFLISQLGKGCCSLVSPLRCTSPASTTTTARRAYSGARDGYPAVVDSLKELEDTPSIPTLKDYKIDVQWQVDDQRPEAGDGTINAKEVPRHD